MRFVRLLSMLFSSAAARESKSDFYDAIRKAKGVTRDMKVATDRVQQKLEADRLGKIMRELRDN